MSILKYLQTHGYIIEESTGLKLSGSGTLDDLIQRIAAFELDKSSHPMDTRAFPFAFTPDFNFTLLDIDTRRNFYREAHDPYPDLTPEFMQLMFQFYDKYCFAGLLTAYLKHCDLEPKFVIGRGTSCAGSCKSNGTITLHKQVFDNIVPDNVNTLTANGLNITSRLDAIMYVFEHELVHLGCLLSRTELQTEHHGSLFKLIANNLFGHTQCTHSLIPNTRSKGKKFLLEQFKPDQQIMVDFEKKGIHQCTVLKPNRVRILVRQNHTQKTYTIHPDLVLEILS